MIFPYTLLYQCCWGHNFSFEDINKNLYFRRTLKLLLSLRWEFCEKLPIMSESLFGAAAMAMREPWCGLLCSLTYHTKPEIEAKEQKYFGFLD